MKPNTARSLTHSHGRELLGRPRVPGHGQALAALGHRQVPSPPPGTGLLLGSCGRREGWQQVDEPSNAVHRTRPRGTLSGFLENAVARRTCGALDLATRRASPSPRSCRHTRPKPDSHHSASLSRALAPKAGTSSHAASGRWGVQVSGKGVPLAPPLKLSTLSASRGHVCENRRKPLTACAVLVAQTKLSLRGLKVK